MTKSPREISPKRSSTLIISIIAIILILFLVKFFIFDKTKKQETEQYGWEEKRDTITKRAEPPLPSIESRNNNTSTTSEDTNNATEPTACQRLDEEFHIFFAHLEEQDYFVAYELNEPAHETINKLTIKLLNNPPIISQETEDLFTVLKNTAHFYRILGHKDLSLMKDILSYEQNDIEHLMAVFYERFLIQNDCPKNSIKIQMPLKKIYEYASFFLNTLGGQSYLFRRDSRLRILAKYYCMLILDQASQKGLNRYNIDEIYSLDSILKEMQDADSLENQNQYLSTLNTIKARLLNHQ